MCRVVVLLAAHSSLCRLQAVRARFNSRGATARLRQFSTSARSSLSAGSGAVAVESGVAVKAAYASAARLSETSAELAKVGLQLDELGVETKELQDRLESAESKPESSRDAEEIRSLGVRLQYLLQDKSRLGQEKVLLLEQKASLEKDVQLRQEKALLQQQHQPSGIMRSCADAVAGRVFSTLFFSVSIVVYDFSSFPVLSSVFNFDCRHVKFLFE